MQIVYERIPAAAREVDCLVHRFGRFDCQAIGIDHVVEMECVNAAQGLHAECRIMPATLSEECAINERDAPRLCQNASLSTIENLLAHDHLLDQDLAVDLESKEINAGCDILSCLGRFPIPVCDVVLGATGQQQIFQRLSAPRVSHTALQYRHRYQLCQKIVDPQTHTVLTSGFHAALLITHCKRNSG